MAPSAPGRLSGRVCADECAFIASQNCLLHMHSGPPPFFRRSFYWGPVKIVSAVALRRQTRQRRAGLLRTGNSLGSTAGSSTSAASSSSKSASSPLASRRLCAPKLPIIRASSTGTSLHKFSCVHFLRLQTSWTLAATSIPDAPADPWVTMLPGTRAAAIRWNLERHSSGFCPGSSIAKRSVGFGPQTRWSA